MELKSIIPLFLSFQFIFQYENLGLIFIKQCIICIQDLWRAILIKKGIWRWQTDAVIKSPQ